MGTITPTTSHPSPRLSVVVPIHNGARWLSETLTSIFSQSFADFELILVDDASSDNLREVLASFHDPRLQTVHLEKNVGVAGARNHGVSLARGELIGFCDADDICLPERFARQVAFLAQHPEIGACGTGFVCFDDTQDLEQVCHPTTPEETRSALMRGNCFGMSTMMGRAGLFRAHPFDQAMSPTEDYDLWTRLSGAGIALANVPDSLLRYRVHAQQASQVKSQRLDRLARKIRSLYCARLLGNTALLDHMQSETLSLQDLKAAATAIQRHCASHPGDRPEGFRFMLAWMYQVLPRHGWRQWWCWRGVQQSLKLTLDWNYRVNLVVLALLAWVLSPSQIDTLTKLKR